MDPECCCNCMNSSRYCLVSMIVNSNAEDSQNVVAFASRDADTVSPLESPASSEEELCSAGEESDKIEFFT